MKKVIWIFISSIVVILIGWGGWYVFKDKPTAKIVKEISFAKEEGVQYRARINEDQFEVYEDNQWQQIPIKGVNIGMAKPATFPGEAAITKEEYDTWLKQIAEMNANTIRVYTLHPPVFYQALKEYNEAHPDHPIYLFHGVWIDEDPLVKTLDASNSYITKEFQTEFKKIADAIHGNITVPEEPGHAHGTYDADVSAYTIGWIIGIEWYPYMVGNMTEVYKDEPDYDGTFVKTKDANGMEDWLAEQLDVLIDYEIENYNQMRPLSFTNWVSTDPLDQPAEPLEQEDLASIHPDALQTKDLAKHVGMFASYHVYPYYPDFLNLDEKYTKYKDHRGEENNYAGYLQDLEEAHDMPVLIAEFGIPASRGQSHRNVHGKNQGFVSERKQGEFIVDMYEDILEADMLGGLIFTWQDEWFKRTWNTMDFDNPDRRPFWSNTQTNEQRFGLLSFDQQKIHLEGDKTNWNNNTSLYKNNKKERLNNVYVDHDEQFLYVRVDLNKPLFKNKEELRLYFQVHNEFGNQTSKSVESIEFKEPQQFELKLTEKGGQLLVDPYYDPFHFLYGYKMDLLENKVDAPKVNSGEFIPIEFALNRQLTRPDTGEEIPFESYETGKLRHGNSNPDSDNYDSLADYFINENEQMIEFRIPWLLLNFKDPSTHEVMGDMYDGGTLEDVIKSNGVGVTAVLVNQKGFIDSLPRAKKQKKKLMIPAPEIYTWDGWDEPIAKPRLKQSYEIVRDYFKEVE